MQAASDEVKYEYERCSVCANGRVFSPHTGLFSTCSLCKGRGIIVTSHKCACGAPVTTKSSDSYLYCGKKSCLTDLRADTAEDKVTAERGDTVVSQLSPWLAKLGELRRTLGRIRLEEYSERHAKAIHDWCLLGSNIDYTMG